MPNRDQRPIRFGVFEVDPQSGELRKQGLRIKLRDQPFQVLSLLLERPGQVVSRDELQKKLWPAETFVDFDRGLNKAIHRLREALGDEAETPRFIETLPKRGYRFIAALEDGGVCRSSRLLAAELDVGVESSPTMPTSVSSRARLQRLVLGAALLAVLGAQTSSHAGRTTAVPAFASSGRIMLAVLPFENLTGNSEQEYLSDGMTEEMITRLGQLQPEHLGVIARTSVMGYKHSNHLDQIARDLGVQYVVEGGVQRSASQLRITVQVIRVKDQTQLWAGMYDRNVEDILRLQSQVAQAVADAVQLNLTPQKRTILASVQTVNANAYDSYLKGRYMADRRTVEGLQKAVLSFRQSIDEDPNYASAYAALGDCYGLMVAYGMSPEDSVQKARSMARKALAIDSSIAEAHATLALIAQNHDLNLAEAEREYGLAFASDPNFAIAHSWHSVTLQVRGHFEESLREIEIAQTLDPRSVTARVAEGETLYAARRYDQAIQSLNRTVEMEPNHAHAYLWRGLAYEQKGMFREAISDLQRAVQLDDLGLHLAGLAHAYALSDRKQEARKILLVLDERAKHQYVDPWTYGVIYSGLGDTDEAFRWLEKAYQQHSYWLLGLKVAPLFDRLHSDQRFTAMVHRLGLDQ